MSSSEDLICPVCGKKPELVMLMDCPRDPVKWRVKCACFCSDEHKNSVHAYLDWEERVHIQFNLDQMANNSDGIGNVRYFKEFGKLVRDWTIDDLAARKERT